VTIPDSTGTDLSHILQAVTSSDAAAFAEFLVDNGLASYWHDRVIAEKAAGTIAAEFLNALRYERFTDASLYLCQKSALQELDNLFNSEGITYAAMKGAHVRELVFGDPALRPVEDIDILIDRGQREEAARSLKRAGFELRADAKNVSHEATFTKGAVAIDLHWDILRPGRTRIEVVELILSRRERFGYFWGLSDTDTVFLMLVHPAFAKYVCSPNMRLVRVLDLVLWLDKRPVDWDAVAKRLDDTGLKVAAWAVLYWFTTLLEPESMPVPRTFVHRICPGRLRSTYLMYWLQNDLPTRWFNKRLLIQLGLTLMLHDRPSDAQRAIAGWMHVRRTQESDLLPLVGRTGH